MDVRNRNHEYQTLRNTYARRTRLDGLMLNNYKNRIKAFTDELK